MLLWVWESDTCINVLLYGCEISFVTSFSHLSLIYSIKWGDNISPVAFYCKNLLLKTKKEGWRHGFFPYAVSLCRILHEPPKVNTNQALFWSLLALHALLRIVCLFPKMGIEPQWRLWQCSLLSVFTKIRWNMEMNTFYPSSKIKVKLVKTHSLPMLKKKAFRLCQIPVEKNKKKYILTQIWNKRHTILHL